MGGVSGDGDGEQFHVGEMRDDYVFILERERERRRYLIS